MNKALLFILIIIIAGVAYLLGKQSSEPATTVIAEAPLPEQGAVQGESSENQQQKRYPIPEPPAQDNISGVESNSDTPVARILPELDESDVPVQEEFNSLTGSKDFIDLFLFKDIIRRLVVTIDNLTSNKLPQRYVVIEKPAGIFSVISDELDEEVVIHPDNYSRYHIYVRLAEGIDLGKLALLYINYYPLFQTAYEELGYPDRYFNDRVIEVIDHLLQTPDIRDPVKLVQPKVYYKFADPELEKLSAGQKILIRMGIENAIKIKARLRVLRQLLADEIRM